MTVFWAPRWEGVLRAGRDDRISGDEIMKLVLLGAPGSGKGTQGEKIAAKYKIPQLSTGDILRAAIRQDTKLGKEAAKFMNRGALVPDRFLLDLMADRMVEADCKNGYILDGFPRTVAQASGLGEILKSADAKLDAVINIDVPESEVVKRLGGRRQCLKCSAVYHVDFAPSKGAFCDKCGGELYRRDDDKEETIKNRLRVYREETAPLADYYKDVLKTVDGRGDSAAVFARISSLIDKL